MSGTDKLLIPRTPKKRGRPRKKDSHMATKDVVVSDQESSTEVEDEVPYTPTKPLVCRALLLHERGYKDRKNTEKINTEKLMRKCRAFIQHSQPSKEELKRRQCVIYEPPPPSSPVTRLFTKKGPRAGRSVSVTSISPSVSAFRPIPIYTFTPRNVLVEDGKALLNIPFIDDNTASDDNPFIQSVLSSYGDRIHKEHKIENNEMFLEMVVKMIDYHEQRDEKPKSPFKSRSSPNKCSPPPKIHEINPNTMKAVCEAIAEAFSDEGQPEDVKERYKNLTEPKPIVTSTHYSPNIDNSNVAISTTREKALNSFKSLFCRRCLMNDCFLHSVEMDIPTEQSATIVIHKQGFIKENQDININPCSTDCYLKKRRNTFSQILSSPNKLFEFGSSTKSKVTPAEQTILRSLWVSQPGQFCLLAETIDRTEATCTTVYDWCSSEFTNFNEVLTRQRSKLSTNQDSLPPVIDLSQDDNSNSSQPVDHLTNGDQETSSTTGKRGPGRKKKVNKVKIQQQKVKAQLYRFLVWQKKAITINQEMVSKGESKSAATNIPNYTPCLDHIGQDCRKANCSCVKLGHFCEKYCLCSDNCEYRFPGCKCNGECKTKSCPCYGTNRECDPDLCSSCGAGAFPEPTRCANVDIQRLKHKHLLLAPSELGPEAGWGCFIKTRCDKNDLVSEYVGEVISQLEADRRGLIYDQKKHSYLFCLNNDFSVDATRYGNKIRFANHSVNPNCYARIMKVNGEHRIGIYAKRDIEAGEELFFDYKYGANERLEFVPIEHHQAQSKHNHGKSCQKDSFHPPFTMTPVKRYLLEPSTSQDLSVSTASASPPSTSSYSIDN